jgi:hypothetical protein
MREYAPFFEWFDKGLKELGVVEQLIESLNATSSVRLRSPHLHRPDPPDCVCVNMSGEPVAIEVVEAVCAQAAHLTARGESVFRVWREGELRTHIGHLLAEKDQKIYHGGPYSEVVACIFTDEPLLTGDHVRSELSDASFGPFRQLSSGFLLLSYDPGTKSYPVFPLKFRHDA